VGREEGREQGRKGEKERTFGMGGSSCLTQNEIKGGKEERRQAAHTYPSSSSFLL